MTALVLSEDAGHVLDQPAASDMSRPLTGLIQQLEDR